MAKFLKDQMVKNVTVDEEALQRLKNLVAEKGIASQTDQNESKRLGLSFIIRFDNKGHRLTDFNDVLKYYLQAERVERVLFLLESPESIRTNRLFGPYLELRLDAGAENNCFLTVSADDSNWVDAAFSSTSEALEAQKNRNACVRNAWMSFFVQIGGVIVGFVACLWAGSIISPHLSIENAFAVSFLFALLIFSNIWTYANQQILRLINYAFPNVRFSRRGKDSVPWLMQTLLGGVILAIVLFALEKLLTYVGTVLGAFLKP